MNTLNEMIFLIDLDGTLLNSDHLHYQAWAKVLDETPEFVERVVTTGEYNDFLTDKELRQEKIAEMCKFENIETMKNVDKFINFIVDNNIKHAVVTHTDRRVVEHFRSKVPILNKLKNWIVREDYDQPKPNSECYELALKLYGEGDKEIVGFENSDHGIKALRGVTHNIFHICPDTDYLKVLKHIKIECQKKSGMPQTSLNHMEKKKLKPLRLAFAMAGSLALVIVLWNLKGGWQTSSERSMDFL
jgi:beta-phosphoglucomutase